MNKWEVQELILRALKEDLGHQDMTTANLIPPEQQGTV